MNETIFVETVTIAALLGFYIAVNARTRAELGIRPAILAILLPAVGFLSPSIWLTLAFCLAIIPVLARTARDIVPLYLLSLFLIPGLDVPGGIPGLKLNLLTTHTCLTVGALLAASLRAPSSLFDVRKTDGPALALMLVLVFISARDTSATHFLREIVSVVFVYGIPYWLVSRLIRTPEDLRLVLISIVLAGSVLSAILIAEVALGWPFYRAMFDRHGLILPPGASVKLRGGLIRGSGPFIEPTSAAFCLMFTVIVSLHVRKVFAERWTHFGVVALLLVGLLLPQSRGAILGLAVALTVAFLYRRAGPGVSVMSIGAMAAAFLLIVAGPSLSGDTSTGVEGSETVEYRQRLLTRGLEEFLETPLVGDSRLSLESRLADLRQGEGIIDYVNTYLWVALHAGLAGFLIFFAAFLVRIGAVWRLRRRLQHRDGSRLAGAAVFACLAAPVEMLFFTSFGGRPAVFLFIFLAIGSALLEGVRAGRFGRGRLTPIAVVRRDELARLRGAIYSKPPPGAPGAA